MSPGENTAEAQAASADAARGRLFLWRAVATVAALAAYECSGASGRLLAGLAARFGGAWWPEHLIYLAISLFGLGVLLLPFSLYEDFVLEARETGRETDFEAWTLDVLKAMGVDLLAGVGFFLALFGLMTWLPGLWWLAGAAVYGVVNAVIGIVPLLQGPPEDELGELRDPPLRERLALVLQQTGRPSYDLLRWHGEEAEMRPLLALQGLGRRRRVLISQAMLRDFTHDEIAALLAHEAAHLRNLDLTRLNVLSTLAALAGFAATHVILRLCVGWSDVPVPAGLASFPLLTCALLVMSFCLLPLLNAFTRRREYIADAVAARFAGDLPLRDALVKLNDGGPAAAPPTTLDLLLNSHPSLAQRLWRLDGGHRR